MSDIRDEWRIRDVEQKAESACRRLYELDSLRSELASLERANGALSSEVAGLRATVETCLARIEHLENGTQP